MEEDPNKISKKQPASATASDYILFFVLLAFAASMLIYFVSLVSYACAPRQTATSPADPEPPPRSLTFVDPRSPVPTTKSLAQYVDPRRLSADPRRYDTALIIVEGRVDDIRQQRLRETITETVLVLWARPRAEARSTSLLRMRVSLRPPEADMLDDQCYRLYGQYIADNDRHFLFAFAAERLSC